MGPSWWQILIVLVLFVLLFGRGKISELMGDVAKGIKSFKMGMSEDAEAPAPAEPKAIEHEPAKPQARAKSKAPRKQKTG
ncbi:MAG: twin-arginine translocase TatA/TatE family subunit [Methyloceanibacter sp.]|uniref:twin-arginine translocase TatA/TatE family subunit n=1 Tax=Methyloceanibacter sp. TaxID=1965321 RepID=UPI003D6DA2CB